MSVLLRYALHHNCRRHLDQLDRLKTILVEKGIVNADEQDVSDESGQSDRNTAFPAVISEEGDQNGRRADMKDGPEPYFSPEKANESMPNVKTLVPDDLNDTEADSSSRCIGSKLGGTGDPNEYDDGNKSHEKMDRDEDQKSNNNIGLDTGQSFSPKIIHFSAATRTPVSTIPERTNAGIPVRIHRSQIDQFLAVDAMFRRITQAISEGLERLDNEQARRSSSLIIHFWNEAARLKGSVSVQSPRMQQKAFFASDWGAGEEIDEPDGNGIRSPGKKENRSYTSPLIMAFKPDDLIWEDQLKNWQLGIGRARDEEGRRCLKDDPHALLARHHRFLAQAVVIMAKDMGDPKTASFREFLLLLTQRLKGHEAWLLNMEECHHIGKNRRQSQPSDPKPPVWGSIVVARRSCLSEDGSSGTVLQIEGPADGDLHTAVIKSEQEAAAVSTALARAVDQAVLACGLPTLPPPRTTHEAISDAACADAVRIARLKEYNDLCDIAQQLIGIIADNRGVPVRSLYSDGSFGVGVDD